MSKPTARNVLVVIGVWTSSRVIASLLGFLVLIHNRLTFAGNAGIVMMWLWDSYFGEEKRKVV